MLSHCSCAHLRTKWLVACACCKGPTFSFSEGSDNCLHAWPQRDWYAPIVADAEAGFGGPLNCFELMKAMIKAGAAGVHFEDQLSSEKKCGHLGGKVGGLPPAVALVPCAA